MINSANSKGLNLKNWIYRLGNSVQFKTDLKSLPNHFAHLTFSIHDSRFKPWLLIWKFFVLKFSFIMLTVWRNSMPMDSFLSKEKCTGIFKCLARNNSTSKQDELNEVHFLAVILTSTPQSLYFFYFLMMYTHFPNCCCCVYLPTYIKENTGDLLPLPMAMICYWPGIKLK